MKGGKKTLPLLGKGELFHPLEKGEFFHPLEKGELFSPLEKGELFPPFTKGDKGAISPFSKGDKGGFKYMRLSYNGKLKDLSRDLRNNSTEAEKKLWSKLRNNQLSVKFTRQKLIGNYIADFYCHKARLVIELDGDQHYWDQGIEKDKVRDEYLKSRELKVLRIPNFQIFKELDLVMRMIWIELGNKV